MNKLSEPLVSNSEEQETLNKKFLESGFGQSLEGDQPFPPRLFRVKTTQKDIENVNIPASTN